MSEEKRLIDANALANRIWNEAERYKGTDGFVLVRRGEIGLLLDEAPVVDAVEVVRCRDCKHCRNLPNGLCYLHTEPSCNERGYKGEAVCVEPDDFCSYGERRKDNG